MGLDLRYPTLPNGIEGLFQYLRLASRVDLVNERHVFSGREDVLELFLGGLEYVVYAIDCPINDLDVLHERLRSEWQERALNSTGSGATVRQILRPNHS